MDIRSFPQAQKLEQCLANHHHSVTLTFRGQMSAGMREKGHSVEEWLDGSIRSLRLSQGLREVIRALGERIWQDEPNRIVQVTGYSTGLSAPFLNIEGL